MKGDKCHFGTIMAQSIFSGNANTDTKCNGFGLDNFLKNNKNNTST